VPYIDREGVKIFYESAGTGSALLLTHGFSASGEMWAPQVTSLADRYRIITWDMRGHGRTDSPDDPSRYSTAATVEDMRAVLGACGVDRAVIGGLSLGGFMSLAFLLAYPAMVRALVLADTGPGYRNADAREKWNERARSRARAFEEGGLAAASASAEVRAATHRSAQGLAHAARGMLTQADDRVINALPTIRVPTLVLVGDRDEPFVKPCQYMATKIPGAELVVIRDATHASNLDQPEQFTRALAAFLERVTTPSTSPTSS
jgi:pimeloyl-ACP methyl ester carboxylesterase